MVKEKEESFKLSYESDGEMGKQQKMNKETQLKHKKNKDKFYFNVTQNSE
ncbi:hypothetical protein SAMN05877753_10833 [Bacillus oleivorans]|uniref:Uncharacterized protein n=1 Tax=Bacillus oleivorans TaxID=1448271 RepID=A0A285D2B3_9BACI|nr:hypothetical protein [Bacillus oleivorans]SNX73912.1 hypothetical protein SAMN05877753_10833 [Bacillus oleivorans]